MTNDSTVIIEQQSLTTNNENSFSAKKIKEKMTKILPYLKPGLINSIITFITFLITLLVSQNLAISFFVTVLTYFMISLFVRPVLLEKFGSSLNLPGLSSNKIKTGIVDTTSKSTILVKQNKFLIGIALLKVEWDMSYIRLVNFWSFFQEEGLQIHDCREGCFLIIRKKARFKNNKSLQDDAKKLIKEIERTTLLTRKKFDMEYENFHLRLVKGQENILTILNLGLAPHKFKIYQEMSEEDFTNLRLASSEVQSTQGSEE